VLELSKDWLKMVLRLFEKWVLAFGTSLHNPLRLLGAIAANCKAFLKDGDLWINPNGHTVETKATISQQCLQQQ